MIRAASALLSLLLAVPPSGAAVLVTPLAEAPASVGLPAAAPVLLPAREAPTLAPLAAPTAIPLSAAPPLAPLPVAPAPAPAPAVAAPAAARAAAMDGRPARSGAPAAPVPASALFDGSRATVPLTALADDPAVAAAFLAAHPDGAGVEVSAFGDAVRRAFLVPPGAPGWRPLTRVLKRAARPEATPRERALAAILSDLPRLTAEGMTRARVSAPSAAALETAQAGWTRDAHGRPVADVVVVGAGPAGLSTALHAAHLGLRTVVYDAGYAAQSFSDAAMKAVYRMRTPGARNTLAAAPSSPPELVAGAGMGARLAEYRELGQAADAALYARTRAPPLLGAREGLGAADPSAPSARNELLQHFADVADEVARRGGLVAERTPVTEARKDADGLWTVIAGGRVQRARTLVLAQGQVGVDVEHARLPNDLRRALRDAGLKPLALLDRRDLLPRNSELDALLSALRRGRRPSRHLLLNDSLLGSPQVEAVFRLLPRGTRAMIVGSGESAVKGAVAALRLNPGLKVDLFVKDRLTAAQLQIPPAHAAPEAIARALEDPETAARTLLEWQEIGTPVTPATLADLEALKASGRLRVVPLGKKCIAAAVGAPHPDHTVEILRVRRGGRDLVRVYAVGPDVVAHLKAEGIGRPEAGTGRWLISEIDGPILSAVGYDRAALRQDALTRMLEEQGRLLPAVRVARTAPQEFAMSPANPLASAGDPDLYVVGAQNFAMSADSAIPGAVARAAAVAADIKARLSPGPRRGRMTRLRAAVLGLFGRRGP